jgi:aspartate/methionine/tyrosine aminotransferase
MTDQPGPAAIRFQDAGVEYLRWAMRAAASRPRISLLLSGHVTPLSRLGEAVPPLLDAAAPFSDRILRQEIAARYGVPPQEVLPVLGTSLGLFLACAALLRAGDEVLVERPGYESLWRVPETLGARVKRFQRRSGAAYGLEASEVAAAGSPETRLVLTSDLHNPTAAAAGEKELEKTVRWAADRGAHVLVDEVYRDFRSGPVDTARRLGRNVVAVSSLTKVYGLGELRAGWVLGPAPLVARMESILTVLHVVPPAPILPWFQRGLACADRLREAARRRAGDGWGLVREWANTAPPGLIVVPPAGGVFVWMVLPGGWTGMRLAERLLHEEGIAVVPGAHFGDDGGIRVGIGGDPALLGEGLAALGRLLTRTPGPDTTA